MIELPDVTLICVDCLNYGHASVAIIKSLKHIKPAKAKLLTDAPIQNDLFETVTIPKIKSKREYSHFIIKELYKHFDTKFVLVIQADGYVINGEAWSDEFLEFDYIGASWIYDHERTVGNGGFSLRSKRLQFILGTDETIDVTHPEDQSICILYKYYLEEKYEIKFATEDVADKFSYETKTPICNTFGFHGYFHEPYKETVIIKRTGAMGDVIQVEPLLHYYYKKGYRVALDTLPQFYNLFAQHYFKIYHTSELDGRLPFKFIDLDMSYESKPKQLHLKTYYEFCGIEDGELRNPRLSLNFQINEQTKLFDKYVVLHIDKREQASRNIYGISWEIIVESLHKRGYKVFQVGKGEHETVKGAIFMQTVNELMLMYLVAGADMFIGIDSGISHIASGFDIPSIIFFGSVNPKYIHADMSNKICIHNHGNDVCDKPFCWHETIGCEGTKCYIDNDKSPCTQFSNNQILYAITQLCQKLNKSKMPLQEQIGLIQN